MKIFFDKILPTLQSKIRLLSSAMVSELNIIKSVPNLFILFKALIFYFLMLHIFSNTLYLFSKILSEA